MILLKQDKNTPRWIVLILDLGISSFALATAYLLRFNFNIPAIEFEVFPIAFGTLLTVRLGFFFLFRTYTGIVRHTSINDFQRIFFSTTVGTIALFIFNLLRYYFGDGKFIAPFSVLIIEFLLTFFLMGSLRVAVKLIYQEILRSSQEKVDVIIFGAGESGITAKRAMDRVVDKRYNVRAFVDENKSKIGKMLEGSKVIGTDEMEKIFSTNPPDQFIMAANISKEKKAQIIECALKYDINAFTIPKVQDWINDNFSVQQIKKVRIEDLLGRKQIKLNQEKVGNELRGRVVMITGAAGSIGSGMVRQIAGYSPEKIIMVDQAESPIYEIEHEIVETFGSGVAEVVVGDIREEGRMENVFRTFRPEVVYHAAAYKHVPLMESNPSEAIRTNIMGTRILVDLADKHKVKKFVMVSTDKAVNPTNVMGASKRISEIYAQSKNTVSKHTKYITTRFGNVLGSNGSVIPRFRQQIEAGGPITVTHPEIIRYFMTIPEACQLVLEAGTIGEGGEIFIFDMGEPVKIVDLAKKMVKLSGLKIDEDIKIKYTGLRPGEKLYEELLANEENTQKTHHPQIMIAKVRNYDFTNISTLICELIEMYGTQNNMNIVRKMKTIVPEFKSKNSIYAELDSDSEEQQEENTTEISS